MATKNGFGDDLDECEDRWSKAGCGVIGFHASICPLPARRLWEQLKKGDILLGDRAYGEFTTLAGLPRQGVDVVARLHPRRKWIFARPGA